MVNGRTLSQNDFIPSQNDTTPSQNHPTPSQNHHTIIQSSIIQSPINLSSAYKLKPGKIPFLCLYPISKSSNQAFFALCARIDILI